MNVLSLFSGIGGLELGLERAGMTVVGQVEIDDYCQQVLAKHWPEVPRHDDVRTCTDWWRSEPRLPVDLVCGGFPCQDISNAGRRAGIVEGTRSSLWAHMADCVRALRPRYVLVENKSQDVITAASLTYRQLDYWTRKGYIHARRHSYGSGNPRDYSDGEMAVAVRMARLVQAGFNPLAASKIARTESDVIKLKPGITLRVEWREGSR